MKVIKAKQEHLEPIVEMGRKFVAQAKLDQVVGEFDDDAVRGFVVSAVKNKKSAIFLAMNGKAPIGMAGFTLSPVYFSPQNVVCQELFWWVEPESRNDGTGKRLLSAAESWARSKKASLISMVSLATSETGKVEQMYSSAGYIPAERTYLKRFK